MRPNENEADNAEPDYPLTFHWREKMSDLRFCTMWTIAALMACASPAASAQAKGVPIGEFGDCAVTFMQDDKSIAPQRINGRTTYKMAAREFRIEVASAACEASIALVLPTEAAYIAQTPLIVGTGAYSMAGNGQTADILGYAVGRNPRTTFDEEVEMATRKADWARQQYKLLCTSLKYCPTPVKHYASPWPFMDPETEKPRTFAEFKRFDPASPMSKAAGREIHLVIYTNWKILRSGTSWDDARLLVLKPNLATLEFAR